MKLKIYLLTNKPYISTTYQLPSSMADYIIKMKNTSVVYSISVSKPLLKPVKLEIQHCAHLVTEDHTSYLSFATASIDQPVLPYQFQLEEGGEFYPGDQYGSISLSQFSLKSIIKSLTRRFRKLLGYDASQYNSELQENNESISDYDEEVIEDTSELPIVGEFQRTEGNYILCGYVVFVMYRQSTGSQL